VFMDSTTSGTRFTILLPCTTVRRTDVRPSGTTQAPAYS
jgi:hypothetical protein